MTPAVRCATVGLCALLSVLALAGAAGAAPAITAIRAFPDRLVFRLGAVGTSTREHGAALERGSGAGVPDLARPRRLAGSAERASIIELRPYQTYPPAATANVAWRGRLPCPQVTVPRFSGDRDRLYSKFELVDTSTARPIGPVHWVDDLGGLPAWDFTMPWPRCKKGVSCPVDLEDLKTLGARYADTGIVLAGIFDWSGDTPRETWEVDGERLPINTSYIQEFDRQIKRMTELGISVTLILVNGVPAQPDPANPLIHPRTDLAGAPYHLGAFNLTDERGLRYYRAAFEYLAHRYSDPSGEHGWVSGYVVGNELQSHWAWHNMGRARPPEVAREYADQLRIAWLAVRRFHSKVRVYASMDHTWATHLDPDPLKSMRGDELLERLNRTIAAEGNFPWHVAFHPYPENLFEPRFWNDQTAVLGFDSPRVTFRNLEVLPAFLAQDRFLYRGRPRRIILSEQGFHCPDGPDGERVQAAAYACAQVKVDHMPTIDAFILHRHVDHRDQGGLRLGLWTRQLDSPDPCAPGRKRLMWDVFRQADTAQWREAFEFAKPIIGIKNWREALPFAGPIPKVSGRVAPPLDVASVVYNLGDHAAEAELANCLDWRPTFAKGPDGLLYPALFHHPPDPRSGSGEAGFRIHLPRLAAGRRLVLRFGTVLTGPSVDGVRMAILVDGEEFWSETQTQKDRATMHGLDLSARAGQAIRLTLRVDALGNNASDWANWLRPVIVREPGGR